MARHRNQSALQAFLAGLDRLSVSGRQQLLTALARLPGGAAEMARVALANMSEPETVALWQELNAARPQSALARVVRGTTLNYSRLEKITNQRERERLASRPGRKLGKRNKSLAEKAIPLLEAGKSLAEVAQLLHATNRDLLPRSYQVVHLSPRQKANLGRYLHKIVKRRKKARSQGLL